VYPHCAAWAFKYLVHIATEERGRVTRLIGENFYAIPIETVKPGDSTDPCETMAVFENAFHLIVRQAVVDIQPGKPVLAGLRMNDLTANEE
jgi:hypothetical protein